MLNFDKMVNVFVTEKKAEEIVVKLARETGILFVYEPWSDGWVRIYTRPENVNFLNDAVGGEL